MRCEMWDVGCGMWDARRGVVSRNTKNVRERAQENLRQIQEKEGGKGFRKQHTRRYYPTQEENKEKSIRLYITTHDEH